jgi:hypothetical protein
MDTSPKDNPWDAGRVVHEMMALWFGSVHGLSIVCNIGEGVAFHLANPRTLLKTVTYALLDLCLHPEYMEPLRDELEGPEYIKFAETAVGLPLLDSLIKESARMHPIDSSKPPLWATTFTTDIIE